MQINSDNSITYTPDAGFLGTDTFIYQVSDSNGGTDWATVSVDVVAGNLNSDPIAHWEFEETSGTTASDSAGGDNPGTLVGATFVNNNKRGRVPSLTSNFDVVTLASPVDLGSDWTIASWFNGLGTTTWKTLTRGSNGDHQVIVSSSGELGSIAFQSTTDVAHVGNYNGRVQRFADLIDDVRIYDQVLNQSDISQLAQT